MHWQLAHLRSEFHVKLPQEHCHSCRDVYLGKLLPKAIPADKSEGSVLRPMSCTLLIALKAKCCPAGTHLKLRQQ